MELDFIDNSDYVRVSTVREVEVSVQKGPVGVTWAILVTEHAPTMNTMVSAPQCTTVLTCAPLPLQGSTVGALLLVQCTSAAVLMLVLSTFLSPGTRASITMQGPAFLPWPACQCYSRECWRRQRLCSAPLQSAAMPPMARAPLLGQSTPYPRAYMAPLAWPMFLFLSMQPS